MGWTLRSSRSSKRRPTLPHTSAQSSLLRRTRSPTPSSSKKLLVCCVAFPLLSFLFLSVSVASVSPCTTSELTRVKEASGVLCCVSPPLFSLSLCLCGKCVSLHHLGTHSCQRSFWCAVLRFPSSLFSFSLSLWQ